MAVKVVSDLHSAVDALAREVHEDDTLLLLGDLINIIDYGAMDGILVDVFGAETVTEVVDLRAQRRFDDARALMQRIRHGREAEVAAKFQALIREGYRQGREALPHRAYVILGNVDSPAPPGGVDRPGVGEGDGRVVG